MWVKVWFAGFEVFFFEKMSIFWVLVSVDG